MVINTDNLVSITEANQNFSRVARMVDENGAAVIAGIAPRRNVFVSRVMSLWSSAKSRTSNRLKTRTFLKSPSA